MTESTQENFYSYCELEVIVCRKKVFISERKKFLKINYEYRDDIKNF